MMEGKKEQKKDDAGDITLQKKHLLMGGGIIAIILLILATNGLDFARQASPVVAEVNGHTITDSELNRNIDFVLFQQGVPKSYAASVSKKDLLNQTIIRELVLEEALNAGQQVNTAQTKGYFESLITATGSDVDTFKKRFENESFDYEYFIQFNAEQGVISGFVNQTVYRKVTLWSEEALKYYNQNIDSFRVEDKIRASHILVSNLSFAEEIIDALDVGENFSQLTQKYSIDGSAASGGDLGFIGKGMMVPEFETAAFALAEVGDYTSEPIQTQYGYHIIQLTAKEEARKLNFDEVRDQIEEALLSQKRKQALSEYVAELLSKADVKVYLDAEA